MIITELFRTREDGVNLYKTYSDKNVYIQRDGDIYEEAIDPEGTNRVYTETDILIPQEQIQQTEQEEEVL